MKALSVNNPWGWCIVNGLKPIENRDWKTSYRGTVLIHVGLKTVDAFAYEMWERVSGKTIPCVSDMPIGGIIGQVDIVDCVSESESHWFFGKYGFVLENAVPYEEIIPCKGALGFFTPDYNSRYKTKLPKIKRAKPMPLFGGNK